jgi:hypothetical protein
MDTFSISGKSPGGFIVGEPEYGRLPGYRERPDSSGILRLQDVDSPATAADSLGSDLLDAWSESRWCQSVPLGCQEPLSPLRL